MSICIRQASIEDAEKILDFFSRLRSENLPTLFTQLDPLPSIEDERSWISKFENQENSLLLIGEKGDRIVAVLDSYELGREQMRHNSRFGFAVDKQFRGRGLGKRMLSHFLSWAKSRPSLYRLELEIFDNNPVAIHLCESYGFEVEGRRKAAFQQTSNHYADVLTLAWRKECANNLQANGFTNDSYGNYSSDSMPSFTC